MKTVFKHITELLLVILFILVFAWSLNGLSKSAIIEVKQVDSLIELPAKKAFLRGNIKIEEGSSNIGFWKDRRCQAIWKFNCREAGVYTIERAYFSPLPKSGCHKGLYV